MFYVLYKGQQGRFTSRIDISQNKSLGTPENAERSRDKKPKARHVGMHVWNKTPSRLIED